MFGKRISRKARLYAVTLLAAACMTDASAATTPRAPTNLCIGTSCAPAPGAGVKFHPGSYVWVPASSYAKAQAQLMSLLSSIAKDSNISGVEVCFKWAELEGDKAGDYSAGFALVDALLAKLASLPTPKRLMLLVNDRAFGTANGGPPVGLLPQYIIDMPNGSAVAPKGAQWAGSLVAIARLDNPAVIDRLIALAQAYGNRYNSNPLMEMYAPMGESSVSDSAGFDQTAFITQMERLYAGAAQAWPNTTLRWQLNWVPGNNDTLMTQVLSFASTLPQSVVGGPDTEGPLPLSASYPSGTQTIQANMIFRGVRAHAADVQSFEDRRGKMPWVGEIQAAGQRGVQYILPADYADYQINVMHASYVVYMQNTYLPANTPANDPHKWAAQAAYIDKSHGATYPGTPATIASTLQ